MLMRICSLRQQRWRFRVYKARETYQEGCSPQFQFRKGVQRPGTRSERRRKPDEGTEVCSERRSSAKNGPEKAQGQATNKPGG